MRSADNNSWSIILSVVGAYFVRKSSLNGKHSCQLFWMDLGTKPQPTLTTPLVRDNLSCAVATIFSILDFLPLSISMAKLSRFVAATFSSLALLSPRPTRADRYRPPSPVFGFSPTHYRHLVSIFWEWPGIVSSVFLFSYVSPEALLTLSLSKWTLFSSMLGSSV